MGFDEWWQLNARFGDDKVRFRQLWSAAIECAQRETVRYAEVQVAAERERWGRRVEVLLPYGGSDGRRDWASAGAWLYPDDVLAVVRA